MVQGQVLPPVGGCTLFNSPEFYNGGMKDVAPTLRAEKNDAGVVVLYED